MASPGRGNVGLVLENPNSPGVVALMGNTALAATISSGYTQPTGSTGMRIEIIVLANTATGTVTVNGTDPLGNVVNEPTPTITVPSALQQSPDLVAFKHLTKQVFGSITSITCSGGLVTGGGLIRINGVQAEKYLIPFLTFKPDDKRGSYSPNVFDGTLSRNKNIVQLLIEEGWEGTIALYPESAMFLFFLLFGAPKATTTIPASPTALGTNVNVTTQPTAPGMALIYTVSGASTGGTIPITGTNQYGQSVSETITASGNGTYYSANIYKNVASSGITGLTGGSYTFAGVFGWNLLWDDLTNADTFYPGCFNFYDGTDTDAYPYSFTEECDFDFGTSKEFICTVKGKAQDGIPIGDRTTSPLSGSRLSTLAQPVALPIPGWQGKAWLDPYGVTPQTNAFPTDLTDAKINLKVPKGVIYGLGNTQRYTQVYNVKQGRDFTFDATVDYRDVKQYEQYRSNGKQTLSVGMLGPFIGNVGATMYQKAWYFTIPFKYSDLKKDADPGKANVVGTYSGLAEYDPTLGYNFQVSVISQMPPIFAN